MIEAYQRAWAALQTGRADRSPCANPLLSHEKPTQRRSNSAADFRDIELSVCPDTLPRFDRILRHKAFVEEPVIKRQPRFLPFVPGR